MKTVLTKEQIADYHRDGYVVIKKFFSDEEIDRLYSVAIEDKIMQNSTASVNDKSGLKSKLSLWFTPGEDVYGLATRSERMVNGAAQLMDSDAPVCHFHSKLMQKEPKVGGAWEWHQDYGYWYKNQFMFPDQLVSIMIALTKANQENGCLQVIKGSHKLGRVNHGFSGEQMGADPVFVENALKTMELAYCDLEAGDALFFHANILHRSAPNRSDYSRWSLISCYNSQSNPAYNETSTAYKIPVAIVPDAFIMKAKELRGLDSTTDLYVKENDPALRKTGWENQVETK